MDSISSQAIDENAYWLALQGKDWLIPTRKVVQVFNEYGSLAPFWKAPYSFFNRLEIDDRVIRKLSGYMDRTQLHDFASMLRSVESRQVKLIRYIDKEYPETLKTLDNPPLILFHKGSLSNFDNCVAIAGTRDPSLFGRVMARRIAKSIASRGHTIVSGLARGIDEWAHFGALEVPKGKTIAVLAWMDPIYPPEHVELAGDIQKRGAILSEGFKQPFDKSAPARFVQRNRITSGVSRCVIAIESDAEGGTVHQMKIALSQKRKVFALQPRGNEQAKRGFKVFMDMGAIPIKSAKEVLDFLKAGAPSYSTKSRLDTFYQHSFDREIFDKSQENEDRF